MNSCCCGACLKTSLCVLLIQVFYACCSQYCALFPSVEFSLGHLLFYLYSKTQSNTTGNTSQGLNHVFAYAIFSNSSRILWYQNDPMAETQILWKLNVQKIETPAGLHLHPHLPIHTLFSWTFHGFPGTNIVPSISPSTNTASFNLVAVEVPFLRPLLFTCHITVQELGRRL